MRTLLLLLICITINGEVFTASAEDLFLGRVVAVDRDAGKLSVVLIEEPDGIEGERNAGRSIDVAIHPAQLPKYLSTGSIVRIWGDMSAESGALNATKLYALGHGVRGKDPTGVRRRIGKGRGRYGGKGGGRGHGRH